MKKCMCAILASLFVAGSAMNVFADADELLELRLQVAMKDVDANIHVDDGVIYMDYSFEASGTKITKDYVVENWVANYDLMPGFKDTFDIITTNCIDMCSALYEQFSDHTCVINVYDDKDDRTSDLLCSVVNGVLTYTCFVVEE